MTCDELLGSSPEIRQVDEDLKWAAQSDAKVLLTGESGTGKEVVARLIHERSARGRRRMVTINCAGVPDSLLASEMFGHTRGSFTDAHRDRTGWLEQAHGGTVFLDEVGEMSLPMQALLLRFLENGEIQRVGHEGHGHRTTVDVRVICATNRRLLDRIRSSGFREDLYYRLNVIHIEIPPLRVRREDIRPLLDHFIRHFSRTHGQDAPVINSQAMQQLVDYDWPGNVRELRNVAERLVVRWSGRQVEPSALPIQNRDKSTSAVALSAASRSATRAQAMYSALTTRGENFWTVVHGPFMARDVTREDVRYLVRGGLSATRGSYRQLVELFNMPAQDYKRFLNFLRKHEAHMSVHEFRVSPVPPRPVTGDRGADVREVAVSGIP